MVSTQQKNELFKKLDAISDVLRKTMDAAEYRNYILGFIFYKFLSEKMVKKANDLLKGDQITFLELEESNILLKTVEKSLENELGYYIERKYLFQSWMSKISNNENVIGIIEESLKYVENSAMGKASQEDFEGLFNDINFTSSKLGHSEQEKEKVIKHVLNKLNDISFDIDDAKIDVLGDAYEHMIANFASEAGKKAGEFYTPQEVSKVLAKIVTSNNKQLVNAYDPTCGSGSLLLQVATYATVGTLYGQETKQTTYNLARMNMFLHEKNFHDFKIKNGDTILNPQHLRDENGSRIKFDVIVANPPFSLPWEAPETLLSDERFSDYGRLAPKSKMDYAFIQHMLFQLSEKGTMATVIPHGVLFRGGSEGHIRKFIIEKRNWLEAVVGLPSNIFYGTSIPSCIMVFKKNRKSTDKILFIEASREFEKAKNQNKLSEDNIDKIIKTYSGKIEIEKYSKLVDLAEIIANDYNLNITRYIDTFEDEAAIDIDVVNQELKEVDDELAKTELEIETMIKDIIGENNAKF